MKEQVMKVVKDPLFIKVGSTVFGALLGGGAAYFVSQQKQGDVYVDLNTTKEPEPKPEPTKKVVKPKSKA